MQAKAIRDGFWQGVHKKSPVKERDVVYVSINPEGKDHFFICPCKKVRDLLIEHHRAFLQRHNGIRPKQPSSLHNAIEEKALAPYLNKWEIIERKLR